MGFFDDLKTAFQTGQKSGNSLLKTEVEVDHRERTTIILGDPVVTEIDRRTTSSGYTNASSSNSARFTLAPAPEPQWLVTPEDRRDTNDSRNVAEHRKIVSAPRMTIDIRVLGKITVQKESLLHESPTAWRKLLSAVIRTRMMEWKSAQTTYQGAAQAISTGELRTRIATDITEQFLSRFPGEITVHLHDIGASYAGDGNPSRANPPDDPGGVDLGE